MVKSQNPKTEVEIKDFLLQFGDDQDEETGPDPDLMRSKVMSMFMRMGGQVGDSR
jgi:hypothetical protein